MKSSAAKWIGWATALAALVVLSSPGCPFPRTITYTGGGVSILNAPGGWRVYSRRPVEWWAPYFGTIDGGTVYIWRGWQFWNRDELIGSAVPMVVLPAPGVPYQEPPPLPPLRSGSRAVLFDDAGRKAWVWFR